MLPSADRPRRGKHRARDGHLERSFVFGLSSRCRKGISALHPEELPVHIDHLRTLVLPLPLPTLQSISSTVRPMDQRYGNVRRSTIDVSFTQSHLADAILGDLVQTLSSRQH